MNTHVTSEKSKAPSFVNKKKQQPFFSPVTIQPKLTIGPVDDPYEREADAMADKVMRMSDNDAVSLNPSPVVIQKKCAQCGEEEKLQRKENNEEEEIVQKKPIAEIPLQRKCAHCEEEEKTLNQSVQLKPVPGVIIQKKCAHCEEEEKEIHRNESTINNVPGVTPSVHDVLQSSGHSLDHHTRSFMESRFGYDFSKVQIHNDSLAHQSSSDINALAYTHGNHIVFGAGQYQPHTQPGKQLLAHELTHVVQQGGNTSHQFLQRQVTPLAAGGGYSGLMARDRNNLKQKLNAPYDAGISQCGHYGAHTEKQVKYFDYRDEVVELKDKRVFDPGSDHGNFISSFWEDGLAEVAVKVRFGSLATGMIYVKQINDYDTKRESIDLLSSAAATLILDVPIIITEEEDAAPESENFQAVPQIIVFHHPDMDTTDIDGTLVLRIEINSGVVTGCLGWVNEKIEDNSCPIKDTGQVNTNKESFIPLIFGIEHKDKNLSGSTLFTNYLDNGAITLALKSDLDINNSQKLSSSYLLNDENGIWEGNIHTNITGAKDEDIKIDRTPQGYLSGNTSLLKLDETWDGKGFELTGSLDVSFDKGMFSAYGHAKYVDKSKRGEGNVTIVLTDYANAERLFKEHSPKAPESLEQKDSYLDTNLPQPDLPLSLTAWGDIKFIVTGEKYVLSGDAAFVVGPMGHIITAGAIKLEKDYVLIEAFDDNKRVFDKSIPVYIFDLGPVYIGLYASASLDVCYDIGSVNFKELIASGYYSNHPDYASEFSLAGTFDMPALFGAHLDAQLTAKLRAGFEKLGYTLASASFYVSGTFCMPVYLRATPSIKYKNTVNNNPQYQISGKLDVQGLMDFILKAGFSISVLKNSKNEKGEEEKDEWDKNILSKRWTLGTFDFSLAIDYILGSGKMPKFTYSGKELDKSDFLKSLVSAKARRAKNTEPKGGFKEGKQQKGEVSSTAFDPLHKDGDPIGPFAVTDSFTMNGAAHTLFLEVSGTEGNPAVDIEMSSKEKRKLLPRLEEELKIVNEELSMLKRVLWQSDFSKKQIKELEAAVLKLLEAKAKTEKQIADAKKLAINGEMSDAGLESIGDSLTDFARLTGYTDLGKQTTTPAPTSSSPPATDKNLKLPPKNDDVTLHLPSAKAIHLNEYRKYITRRLLWHSLNRSQRDTNQKSKWDSNQKKSMLTDTKCRGVALDLLLSAGDDRERNILRPFWTKRSLIGTGNSDDFKRMNVDHVIEWQVRPITGGDWIDEPANFELLDFSSNSSAGTRLDDNIKAERQRLAKITNDISWTTDDIYFTKVEAEGSSNAERYTYDEIETGKHLNDYEKLTRKKPDKEVYEQCKKTGGVPF